MKNLLLLCISLFILNITFAERLILVNSPDAKETKNLYTNKDISIRYVSGNLVIAVVKNDFKGTFTVLDENYNPESEEYYIAWFHKKFDPLYANQIKGSAEIIHQGDRYLVLKTNESIAVPPPTDGRITRILKNQIQSPSAKYQVMPGQLKNDPVIEAMMDAVDTNIYLANLQHLQDYGTRNAYTTQSVDAQNWIKAQFESYGYTTELFDFAMPGGPASDDVIATKTGTTYPDEYVILGGHYDSYSFSGNAPGADDDGTGACGVLEAARVMANFETDRTILFCAWSGEEYGLYGSDAWANWAAGQGLNILGYFNIDMCGYLEPGSYIHADMIAPASAQPLVDFYFNVCNLYLPDFVVEPGNLTGGDSDHTSFNNAGYMGIFPFEDSQNYSPYIHSSSDIIGTSVNSLEQAMLFTQAMVANVATMANWLAPPSNLIATAGDNIVELSWDPLSETDHYNVYKDNNPTPVASPTDAAFTDNDVSNFTTYTYYVTAVLQGSGEETDPSDIVTVTPLPPMVFPFVDDFETGAYYWSFGGSWGLSTAQSVSPDHSMTESPVGNYPNNVEMSTTLYTFGLESAISAGLSFQTIYNLEEDYDYTYLEISVDGVNWQQLDDFNGTQSTWILKTYSLTDWLGQSQVIIRFRFVSDSYVTADGMYIDDVELNVSNPGTGTFENAVRPASLDIFPNPVQNSAQIHVATPVTGSLNITLWNTLGKKVKVIADQNVKCGEYHFNLDSRELPDGIYFCKMKLKDQTKVKKLIIK